MTPIKTHMDVFSHGSHGFICYEIHDAAYLLELCASSTVCNGDKRTIKKFVRYALKYGIGSSFVIAPVVYQKTAKSGKYCAKVTLQNLQKCTKDKIYYSAEYMSLDIVNAGYAMIFEMAKIYNLELPAVKEFIENRENIYLENGKCWNNDKPVKSNFCKLISCPVHFAEESKFVTNLIDEILLCHKVFQQPDYPEFTFGKTVETLVTSVTLHIVDYLTMKVIIFPRCFSLNYDELYFQPLKPFRVRDIEEYVFQQTNFYVQLRKLDFF